MNRAFRLSMLLAVLVIVISGFFVFHMVFFGGRDLTVPPLKDMQVLDAMELLEKMELQARVDKEDSVLPRGTIVAQWPDPGTKVRRDRILILKVSKGGLKQSLPDVRGMEYSQAVAKLEQMNFSVGDVVRIHDDRPAGVVVAQDPAAPVMVEKLRSIQLLVSRGPLQGDGRVVVPDVLQRNENVARKLLSESGLNTKVKYVYTQASPEDMVIAMTPRPGRRAARKSRVLITVATLKKAKAPASSRTSPKRKKTSPAVVAPGMSSRTEVVEVKPRTDMTRPKPVGVKAPVVVDQKRSDSVQTQQKTEPAGEKVTRSKVAKIRYQVPPLSKALILKIEIVDGGGNRIVMNKEVKGGEYVSQNTKYAGDAVVTIFLGGEFVWQDRYR